MSFFEKNLKALQDICPIEAHKLQNQTEADPLPIQLEITPEKSSWHFQSQSGTFQRGVELNPQLWNSEQHMVLLYGTGDTEYLERLTQNSEIYYILVYEPSITLFKQLLEQKDITHLIRNTPKIRFFLGTKSQFFLKELQDFFDEDVLRYFYSGYFANLITPGIQNIPQYQDYVLKFVEAYNTAIRNFTALIKNEPPEDAFRGFMCVIEKIKTFSTYPNITQLKDKFKDYPAIIVGSGPSLEKSLPYLKEAQDKALIFSCDTTLKILLNHGIQPHFSAVLERVNWQANYFKNIPKNQSPSLIALSTVHPDVFKVHQGPVFAMRRSTAFDPWIFPEETFFEIGSSVSHLCLMAAKILGCSQIFYIGIDCAYHPDSDKLSDGRKLYPSVATDEMKAVEKNIYAPFIKSDHAEFEMTGYNNKPKKTDYYLYKFAGEHTEMIKRYKIENIINIMPVEFGIPIAGTTRQDPDFITSLNKKNPTATEAVKKALTQTKINTDSYQEKIQATKDFLIKTKKMCLEEDIKLSQFFTKNHPDFSENRSKYKTLFQEIEKIRHNIMLHPDQIYLYLVGNIMKQDHALIEFELRNIFTKKLTPSKVIEKQIEAYKEWFSKYYLWSERILKFLEMHNL